MPAPRILVVDDDADTREVVQLALQCEGFEVETAANQDMAISAISRRSPTAILIDYFMDGTDLSKLLDHVPLTVPIILMTGAADREQKARDQGLRFSIQKPFEIDTLIRILKSALQSEARMPKTRHKRRQPSTH